MCLPSKHKTFVYHLYNVVSTWSRWADVAQLLYKCFVFAGTRQFMLVLNLQNTNYFQVGWGGGDL